jgi:DNA-binding FrmR family transcriptional regulator
MQMETWPITMRFVVTGWQIPVIWLRNRSGQYTMVGYSIGEFWGKRSLAHILRDKKKMLNRVRRLRGQVESIEHAIEREADCSEILHTISACRGAFNSLMAEVLDGHIRFHVMDPDQNPTSEKARAAQELIDVLRSYLR